MRFCIRHRTSTVSRYDVKQDSQSGNTKNQTTLGENIQPEPQPGILPTAFQRISDGNDSKTRKENYTAPKAVEAAVAGL